MDSFASGFAKVDKTNDADSFVQYLDLIHSIPFFRESKTQSYCKLNLSPGDSVLEIGCGNGTDLNNLAKSVGNLGMAVGIDISSTMLNAARKNATAINCHPECILCDGLHLAFPTNTFHGVRSDRVIQHTSDPFAVIKEIARVTRPEGRVVIFEPDWETYTLWPGDPKVCRKVMNFWCDNIPSGKVGRLLYAAFSDAALIEIEVYPYTLTVTNLSLARQIFDLDTTFSLAVREGIVNQTEVNQWEEELSQADHTGQFFSTLTFFLVTGKKQSPC
ncbi:methyltransferase domain-containing protein [Methanospirillum lacunae]|uniref:Class I SAM-dependent methyltransferase n=1 Tax=Methanospirillum lacunae TaxID=668570 RepID=A0A2V2NCK0_9EURY|nr:methyltransferase domain-containing protein [Methanospirillum lacunae]PWR73033.1 class I SAM-dependent methyltransferase [Methanospirillum lacunae]